MRNVIAVCLAVAPMAFAPALAAEFRETIYEYLNRPQSEIEETYPLVRCAGLYSGLYNLVGKDQLGAEAAESMERGIDAFTQGAALIRSEKWAGSISDIRDSVLNDAFAISEMYIERMRANYRSGGGYFGEDRLINGDLVVCRTLLSAE